VSGAGFTWDILYLSLSPHRPIHDCLLLLSDKNYMGNLCAARHINVKANKRRTIFFSRRTNTLTVNNAICNSGILCTGSVKDLGAFLDSELYSVPVLSRRKVVGPNTHCYLFHFSFRQPHDALQLPSQFAPVASNSCQLAPTNLKVFIKSLILCKRAFKYHNACNYGDILGNVKLNALHVRRCYFDVLFMTSVYSGFVMWPSMSYAVGLRVPNKNFKDFAQEMFFCCLSLRY
jgi:hypothetical protein